MKRHFYLMYQQQKFLLKLLENCYLKEKNNANKTIIRTIMLRLINSVEIHKRNRWRIWAISFFGMDLTKCFPEHLRLGYGERLRKLEEKARKEKEKSSKK